MITISLKPRCRAYPVRDSDTVTHATPRALESQSFSSAVVDGLGRTLGVGAVLLALLPVPIAALDILPTYLMHARFLIFFAPVACFLEVAYLFYVRDILARLLYRHILEPEIEPDPYYRPRLGEAVGTKARSIIIVVLPLALMGLSLYCLMQYTARFERSVELAEQVMFDQLPPPARRPFVFPRDRVADSSAHVPGAARQGPDSVEGSAPQVAPELINQPALRQYVLAQAGIEDIPFFGELTAWFIGMFFSAIGAALLMMLKEHAREIMGVSEEMLILGGEPGPVD